MIVSFRGDYYFLSNFYPASITYADRVYPTSEHAYQAYKTLTHDDHETIRLCPKPGLAKRLVRTLPMRSDWPQVKFDIMLFFLWEKFCQHPDLAAKLLATGDEELIEGNTWGDIEWGVCNGRGQNRLGILLMQVRDELRKRMIG